MLTRLWVAVAVSAGAALTAAAQGFSGDAGQATSERYGAPRAFPLTPGFFRTPSGNIQCYGNASPGFVHCGIKSGFKPPPPRRGSSCTYPDRISLNAAGRSKLGPSICPGEDGGDSGPYAPNSVSRVLGYGKTWKGGGIRCTSAVTGLTCRNKSGHGFFLSRARWRTF